MIEDRAAQMDDSGAGHGVRLGLRALWALGVVGLGVFVAHVGLGLLSEHRGAFEALYVCLFLLAAALCIAEGVLFAKERTAWLLFGVGIGLAAAGWAYYFLVLEELESPPYPSLADALWLPFFPLSLIALMLLLRSRIVPQRSISWVDALIAALTLAAISAALLVDPVLDSTGGSLGAVITSLAYPLADVLVLGLIARVLALSGWRPGKTWLIIGAAWAIRLVADTIYLFRSASGDYAFGTPLDASWPAVMLLLAYVALQAPERREPVTSEGWSVVVIPMLAVLAALAITTYDSFHGTTDVAVVLATAVLVLAFVRAATMFAELRSLAHSRALLARHESILESAGEGIWGLDRDGRSVFANKTAAELTGYSVEELLAPRMHDLVHHTKPDGTPYPVEECPVHRTLRDGAVHEVSDEVYFRKDGTSFPVEYTSTPIWEDGEVRGAVVVFRDITERRQAERALRESEQRTRQSEERTRRILATAHDAFVSIDKDGRIIDCNAAAEKTFGWRRAEAIGRPFGGTLRYHDERESVPAGLEIFSQRGEGVIELMATHRDGHEFPIELSISAMQTDDGYVYNAFLRDISERRDAQLQLQRERDFLNAVLENLRDGVVACAPDGTLSLFNRATREMHGLSQEALPPEEWASHYDLFMPDGKTPMPPDQVPLRRALRGERVRDAELVIAPKDRPPRKLLCNGQPIASRDGRALGAVVAMHDITERRKAEEQLLHQALHDSLTGLPNRALLLDRLRHALASARRDNSAVAVLFTDLDHFKRINDGLGHHLGDELLKGVATRLDEALRAADTVGRPSADTVARLGGDEFVVLCEGLTSERDAIRIAARVSEALERPFVVAGEQVFASASIGIVLDCGSGTAEGMLRDADAAMYRAKERGRARYELFDEAMRARIVDRLRRENELRRAIEQGELRLCYQPIVSVADRRVVAAEALVRWEHPERGLLPPAEFVELAEESGLIFPLGGWVLREACRQLARWEKSFGDQLPLRVSVNISARQLAQPQLVKEVERAVAETAADPRRLALELTETILMEAGDTPAATLKPLKQLGIQLVLDDFGTGYSSLSYLERLPLDILKLDRSFVAPLGPRGQGRGIASAVIQMAHALDIGIVAEGVETEDQHRVLQELECDMAQGYLFARPMPAPDMTDLLDAAATAHTLRGSSVPRNLNSRLQTPDARAIPAWLGSRPPRG